MKRVEGLFAFLLSLLAALAPAQAAAAPIPVASPETVFLDVARQIGGSAVVAEIVKPSERPAQPPQILITEGDASDRWVSSARERLRASAVVAARKVAPDLAGDGPSWYDLSAMGALGGAIAAEIARAAPDQASGVTSRRDAFLIALAELKLKSKQIVDGYGGTSVLLTDARFEPFCRSLGLKVVTIPPQGEAAKSAIAAREGIVLIYNADDRKGLDALKAVAEDSGLPLVGLRLTLPSALSYQQWIGREINLVRGALNEAAP
ncbi:MAG TPA: zinc ABC transporter substrate-binding protein [Roseiarcus sp.]|jgi:ABC-type Zn uptake system ZnuABC Zn-binding protein ZnuA